ncbi:carotenoid oxygenase family protein [Lyngbya confervoides]|uniref:Carotenoid oxygenase family protein n=1 Tax=Lyngbya confervoides BDU141951 TaxID=1574623 RepID=A0ABD4T7U3_9CYAN|nr:carotenoid oxygenase family protein [Lyngbya confervoides]MCM1984570.1 carotenoid oxygenase family protein [Lyngbya confervoides BDU141951]
MSASKPPPVRDGSSSQEPPLWYACLQHPATEFTQTPLPVLAGAIPAGLTGTLYRNGPARFERGGTRVSHWFDGDGAVLAVSIAAGSAMGCYQYVKTREYLEEDRADCLLYGGYGTLPAVGLWNRMQRTIKNAANTSVLLLPDRLLALWEGGKPHGLNLETLETLGIDDLGFLGPQQTFSAHPKQDPVSGEIYNFGVSLGREGQLFVYRCDRWGRLLRQTQLPLKDIPLIHDFLLAGPYLVFCIPPVFLKNPLLILLGMKSYSDCLQWRPQRGTQLLILDRETLEVLQQQPLDPWFQWHVGNGYLTPSGHLDLTVMRYDTFQTNQFLKEVITGYPHTEATAQFWQLTVDPHTGRVIQTQTLLEESCEFPVVPAQQVGLPQQQTFFALQGDRARPTDLLQDLGRYHHPTATLTRTALPPTHYPMEPIYVPSSDCPDRGWILSVLYDGDRHTSEVWIWDSDHLDADPLCRLGLPAVIPIGFHGQWQPRAGPGG